MRKKILFLIQLPPPVHGASIVNMSIYDSELINNAFQTQYIDISPAKDISDVGKFSLSKLGLTFLVFFRALAAYIKFKPDLVYVTLSPHGLAFYKDGLLALVLKALGARMVFHMHGKGIQNQVFKSKLYKALYRTVFRGADVIHLSEKLFYDIENVRDQSKLIFAIANSADPVERTVEERGAGRVRFIYLSNLIPSKGADVVALAARTIPADLQCKFEVSIIGGSRDQAYKDKVEKIIGENPFGNIYLKGPMYGKDKVHELTSSNVFILPTSYRNECFPISILEAMSAKLAIISTDEGAISEMVEDGVTGALLKSCSAEALAGVMRPFIECPEEVHRLGQNAFEKYKEKYTRDIFERNMVSALQRCLENNL